MDGQPLSELERTPEVHFRHLITDYQVAHAVSVAAQLRIRDLLESGPQSTDVLARVTNTHPRALFRLLRALVSSGVVGRTADGQFAATPLTGFIKMNAPDPEWIRSLPGGLPHEREAWAHLTYSIATGESAFHHLHGMSSWEYHNQHPAMGEVLHGQMSQGTVPWTGAVLAAYSFTDARCVVDVGGGRGALIATILRENPGVRGILFDQPRVVSKAEPLLREAGVADRCAIVAGDFFAGVPFGGDVYLGKSILHNWDDDAARRILANVRAVMPSDGKLVLVEPVLDPDDWTQRAMFFMDLHMLVLHGARERTADEFSALLTSAGFQLTRIVHKQISVIEAVPI